MNIIKVEKRKGSQMTGNNPNSNVFTGLIISNNQKYISFLIGVESALEAKWYGGCLKSSVFYRTSGFDSQPGRRQSYNIKWL